jgi:hypothetical protein
VKRQTFYLVLVAILFGAAIRWLLWRVLGF